MNMTEPIRCSNCDTVIPAGSGVCLMCGESHPGTVRDSDIRHEPVAPEPTVATKTLADEMEGGAPESIEQAIVGPTEPGNAPAITVSAGDPRGPAIFESQLSERRSHAVLWMTGFTFVITAILGSLVLRYGEPVQLALAPSPTPIAPTSTLTPTATERTAVADAVVETPTVTAEPTATETLQPPRAHQVGEGETLFGLAYIYNVSMDVIAELNGFSVETPIQSGQTLQIPWPTATPPLVPVEIEINGEPVIADPTDCERYEIQEGDALSVIAARNNINFDLLLRVNRLTDQSIMQPGDTICMPRVVHGEVLPPTPGPSPTPSATSFPPGPTLLYPTEGTVVEMGDEPVVLQWLAVKDLAQDEWYMIELTDLDVVDQHPQRAFTRDNAFRIPSSWRPPLDEYHAFRWRVSIVNVTGQREDGGFIYAFGGRFSEDGNFVWKGAVPTATPTVTSTSTPTTAEP